MISGVVFDMDGFFHTLAQRLEGKKVIGVSGADCSGKTVLADNYARWCNDAGHRTEVAHIDDFHNPSQLRTGLDEVDVYYRNAFNYEQLISEVLEPLRTYGEVHATLTCLDLETDRYEKQVRYDIDPGAVLIVEGVLLFRSPLVDFFDATIWVQISEREELRRAQARDPANKSDIVIDNNDYGRPYLQNPS